MAQAAWLRAVPDSPVGTDAARFGAAHVGTGHYARKKAVHHGSSSTLQCVAVLPGNERFYFAVCCGILRLCLCHTLALANNVFGRTGRPSAMAMGFLKADKLM